MIKIYLLLLIIIFLSIMLFKREHFQEDDCPPGKQPATVSDIILNGESVHRNGIDIDIHWNHPIGLNNNADNIIQYVIIKNISDDVDYISELEKLKTDKDGRYNYTIIGKDIKPVIEVGQLYAITVNILDKTNNTMFSSNPLRIKPQPSIDNSEEIMEQVKNSSYTEQLLVALKNKTFDIYL